MSEAKGEFFGDADAGLFEGDMRLTGDQLLALGMGKEEEARGKRQEGEGEGGEGDEGEFFGDAIEDGLFEGDMRLTGDQLLALQRGTLETHGDLEGVTYSHHNLLLSTENTNSVSRFLPASRQAMPSLGQTTFGQATLSSRF